MLRAAIAEKEMHMDRIKETKADSEHVDCICELKESPETAPAFLIVGIGASLSRQTALRTLLQNLSPDAGIAFILVSSDEPDFSTDDLVSWQGEIALPMQFIEDPTEVQPNNIYVCPSNKDVGIMERNLFLTEPAKTLRARRPIDFFMRSLAHDQGVKAAAVLLAATGADGYLGIKEIKSELGVVIAEDTGFLGREVRNEFLKTSMADYVLPVDRIPGQLVEYAANLFSRHELDTAETFTPSFLKSIIFLLRAHSGHDFSSYKSGVISRRLERRMNLARIPLADNYLEFVRGNATEMDALLGDFLINVTSFFRDTEIYDYLRKVALPELLSDKPDGYEVRVWSAGCSTGEEAYSLAMILRSCIEEMKRDISVQVFATDVDDVALEYARIGKYPTSIESSVTPEYLQRYYSLQDDHYLVKREIRKTVIFAHQDVISDPPFAKLDLIFCRNLLIYLEPSIQRILLPMFHYALNPNGLLVLGTSETVGISTDLFQAVHAKHKIYQRKEMVAKPHSAYRMCLMPFQPQSWRSNSLRKIARNEESSVQQMVEQVLLDTNVPPAVFVNEKGDIVYVHGRTGKFLEPASGQSTLNVLAMSREGLRFELRSALQKASADNVQVKAPIVRIKTDSGTIYATVTVEPVREPKELHGLFLITFQEHSDELEVADDGLGEHNPEPASAEQRIKELEQEITRMQALLHSTVEEIELSYAEVASTNEELQSTNEELQSSNEELETSKEEMQSLYEELVSVNMELTTRLSQLTEANDDILNLLDSTNVATIFLDSELRIKRFTPLTNKIVNLISTDIGRPLNHFVFSVPRGLLLNHAKTVLETLSSIEEEVQTEDGHWYLMKISPYKTVDDRTGGVVVTFVDIHELKSALSSVKDAHDNRFSSDAIFQAVAKPMLLLDAKLRILNANLEFCRMFRVSLADVKGAEIGEFAHQQWNQMALLDSLREALLGVNDFQDMTLDYDLDNQGRKRFRVNAHRISPSDARNAVILMLLDEVDA